MFRKKPCHIPNKRHISRLPGRWQDYRGGSPRRCRLLECLRSRKPEVFAYIRLIKLQLYALGEAVSGELARLHVSLTFELVPQCRDRNEDELSWSRVDKRFDRIQAMRSEVVRLVNRHARPADGQPILHRL